MVRSNSRVIHEDENDGWSPSATATVPPPNTSQRPPKAPKVKPPAWDTNAEPNLILARQNLVKLKGEVSNLDVAINDYHSRMSQRKRLEREMEIGSLVVGEELGNLIDAENAQPLPDLDQLYRRKSILNAAIEKQKAVIDRLASDTRRKLWEKARPEYVRVASGVAKAVRALRDALDAEYALRTELERGEVNIGYEVPRLNRILDVDGEHHQRDTSPQNCGILTRFLHECEQAGLSTR